jgi:predicted O-methyltransferase YrrM
MTSSPGRTHASPQSQGTGIVTDAVGSYLASLRPALGAELERIRERGHQDRVPIVHDEVGALLELLVRSRRPRRVVEFGTAIGYSTAWLARGLAAGATLTSFELDPARHDLARELLAPVATAGTLDLQLGDALELMNGVGDPVDMAFLDATKGEYSAYLEWVLAHMPEGGVVLVDNALMGGYVAGGTGGDGSWSEADLAGQRAFNERFVADPRLQGMVLPVGDGLAMGVRTAV